MVKQNDENSELELEHSLKIPAPLDPHVASISLRTGTNNPSDYFDLLLSASFGSEYVTLDSGDDTIEVKISIQKAEVKFDTVNCRLHLVGAVGLGGDGWKGVEKKSVQINSTTAGKAQLSAHSGAIAKDVLGLDAEGSLKAEKSAESSSSVELARSILPFTIINSDTIQIGYGEDFSRNIQGRVIDESIGVRVTPLNLDKKVGVLSRIRVRERWINIEDSNPIKASGRLMTFFKGINSNGDEQKRKKELFSRLVAHLIAVELQEISDDRNATLCAAAMVFSPVTQGYNGVTGPAQRARIRIDPRSIDRFLQAEAGEEIEVLQDLGVDLSSLDVKTDLCRSFEDLWGKMLTQPVIVDSTWISQDLAVAFACSFGCDVSLSHQPSEEGILPDSIKLLDRDFRPASAAQIVESFPTQWPSRRALIDLGLLAKGEWAFAVAKLLDFPYSYQTLQKRMRPYAYVTGYGNLISICDLFRAVGAEARLHELRGATLLMPSYHVVHYVDFEQIPTD